MDSEPAILAIDSRPDPEPSIAFPALSSVSGVCHLRGLPRLFQWRPSNTATSASSDRSLQQVHQICKKLEARKSPIERMQNFLFSGHYTIDLTFCGMERTGNLIYEPADGTGQNVTEANVYYDVKLNVPNWPAVQNSAIARGFWDFRCKDLTGNDNLGKGYRSATVHTGICLFSDEMLQPLRDTVPKQRHGERDQINGSSSPRARSSVHAHYSQRDVNAALDTLQSADLSLYEEEGISRLSAGTALFAAILCERLLKVNITIDIPTVQYFELALEAISNDIWSVEQALRWCDIVEARAGRLGDLFEGHIRENLAGVGRKDDLVSRIRIERSTGLRRLSAFCKRNLVQRRSPLVPELLHELTSSPCDSGWLRYLTAIDEEKISTSFSSLACHSYVYELLSSVFRDPAEQLDLAGTEPDAGQDSDDSEHTDDTRCAAQHLIICVDSSAERRTFYNALKLVKDLRKQGDDIAQRTLLLGAYPLERIITTQGLGVSSLYTHDPGESMVMGEYVEGSEDA